jgi:hypothetical protein
MNDNWLCAGTQRWRVSSPVAKASDAALGMLSGLTSRVARDGWIRYYIDLATAPPAPPDVSLTPVTEAVIDLLRTHPDRGQNQLQSGFRFWDRGLQCAFAWLDEDGPLCVQWLLTQRDNDRLRRLPVWGGMYPPIPHGCGQVENLYTFSTARRKGVASQFEFMLYEQARHLGLSTLITHIHADNAAARGWATRTGWSPRGAIRRYTCDAPGMRGRAVYVHRANGSQCNP